MGQQRLLDQAPASAERGSSRKINPAFVHTVKWGEKNLWKEPDNARGRIQGQVEGDFEQPRPMKVVPAHPHPTPSLQGR